MSLEDVRKYLRNYDLDHEILEFDVSSATVPLAAKALGCEESRIAKTLSFLVSDQPIVVVLAGDQKIDNRKYRNFFHAKAKMIPFDQVEEITGHEVGGVCPFGLKKGVKVYLDESLKRFETVYPACGAHNSAIKITPEKLFEITQGEWIDVGKNA